MGRTMVMQSKFTPGFIEKLMAYQVDRARLARSRPSAATSGNLHEPAGGTGAAEGGWAGKRETTGVMQWIPLDKADDTHGEDLACWVYSPVREG